MGIPRYLDRAHLGATLGAAHDRGVAGHLGGAERGQHYSSVGDRHLDLRIQTGADRRRGRHGSKAARFGPRNHRTTATCLDGPPSPHSDRRMPDHRFGGVAISSPYRRQQVIAGPCEPVLLAPLRGVEHANQQDHVLAVFCRSQPTYRVAPAPSCRQLGEYRTRQLVMRHAHVAVLLRSRALISARTTSRIWPMRCMRSGQ